MNEDEGGNGRDARGLARARTRLRGMIDARHEVAATRRSFDTIDYTLSYSTLHQLSKSM